MQAAKIIVGLLLLFGGLKNIPGAFEMSSPREAAGYLMPTFFFIILGAWLFYSGVKKKPRESKIYDRSDDYPEASE